MLNNRHTSILRAVNGGDTGYNILTAPTHESFQSNWSTIPHFFYMLQHQGFKTWDSKYRKMPKNHILLNGQKNQIPPNLEFDIVISQNKFGQFQVLDGISKAMNIPLISLEHTLPMPHWDDRQMDAVKNMKGNINVFISKYSVNKWGFSLDDPSVRVINHGVNTDLFCPSDKPIDVEPHALAICNDFVNRDRICGFQEWKTLVEGFSNKIFGDTPGLSKACTSTKELVNEYQSAAVFVNTTLISPIPTVVLEAMACGIPTISLDNCMLPEVITNEYNGYLSNDLNYLRDKLKLLLENRELREEMGRNARKTILERFSLEKHNQAWIDTIKKVYGRGR